MDVESELLAEGEMLLSRREEIERAITREYQGSGAALAVHVAHLVRQRDRVRVELRRITEEADERGARESDEDELDPDDGAAGGTEDFYAARERLALRDRELVAGIEALERRIAALRKAPVPPPLLALAGGREQVEGQLRQWRARCRRLGVALTLARFDEYAGVSMED